MPDTFEQFMQDFAWFRCEPQQYTDEQLHQAWALGLYTVRQVARWNDQLYRDYYSKCQTTEPLAKGGQTAGNGP